MPFLRRLGFYLGGFAIGLIILAFIWKKKDAPEFCYGPNCRVLKDIRSKEISNEASIKIDSLALQSILKKGNVLFSKSDTKSEPCRTYFIEKDTLELKIKNCDSTAVIQKVFITQ